MTGLHPRSDNGKQPANEPEKPTNVGNTKRLACPFDQRFPLESPISKTCGHGSPDIRHVKEHVQKYHSCNCRTTLPADALCRNPLHLTPTQLSKLRGMKRRSKNETLSAHWDRLFCQLFPDAPDAPRAPYLPTSAHLKAMADDMTDEFAGAFGRRLHETGLLGPPGQSGVEAARLFARQYMVFVEVVSSWGFGPSRPAESSGDTPFATTQLGWGTLAGGENVDSSEMSQRVEPANNLELPSHEELAQLIENSEWTR